MLNSESAIRRDLSAAMAAASTASAAADRLCEACVELFHVDGAAMSLIHDGATYGTFGSSGEMSRRLDELQFTFGEGPCLDAARSMSPVLVGDLSDEDEHRWPAFTSAVLEAGVRGVFALPVTIAASPVGALDLIRRKRGDLGGDDLNAGLLAAKLAVLPLLDLMSTDVDWESVGQAGDGWDQLASLERVEVYQATGMIAAALDVSAATALIRLRAYAYARDMTASELGWDIVEGRVSLTDAFGASDRGDSAGGSR